MPAPPAGEDTQPKKLQPLNREDLLNRVLQTQGTLGENNEIEGKEGGSADKKTETTISKSQMISAETNTVLTGEDDTVEQGLELTQDTGRAPSSNESFIAGIVKTPVRAIMSIWGTSQTGAGVGNVKPGDRVEPKASGNEKERVAGNQ